MVAHLISEQVEAGADPEEAVRDGVAAPARCICAGDRVPIASRHADRRAARLAVGGGLRRRPDAEIYLGSDALALAPLTQRIAIWTKATGWCCGATARKSSTLNNNPVTREIRTSGASAAAVEKGNYRHFMQKEIFEQPTVVAQTLRSYICARSDQSVALPQIDFDLSSINRVTIVACGT